MAQPHLSAPDSTWWRGSPAVGSEGWPEWLSRVSLADFCSIEVLLTVARSAREELSRGAARAILARMEAAGHFRGPAIGGVFLLRSEVETSMLAELDSSEGGIERAREQLTAAGLAKPAGGIGAQLAKWTLESEDWASSEEVWRTHSPGELVADPDVREGYAALSTEVRARHPGLSVAAAVAVAYQPELDRLDLDRMITALVRDGRTLCRDWARHDTAEARIVSGSLWLLASVVTPVYSADTLDEERTSAQDHLVKLIRDSSLADGEVSARALTLFHAIVSLLAFLRGDWSRARREGEFALILNEGCGLPAFLAAVLVGFSSAVAGATQDSSLAEKFLTQHVAHGCRTLAWLEPVLHLMQADSGLRTLDRDKAQHHLRRHAIETSSTQWFDAPSLHAAALSTSGILWDDAEQALARFDSLAPYAVVDPQHPDPWNHLLLRCRVELLLALGSWSRAEQIVGELLANADESMSSVPAVWFYLCVGRLDEALSLADRGIFELRISLADRAFLYAAKSAALHRAGSREEYVASAATAACLICEQAHTLLPFATLPAADRSYLVTEHRRHHADTECLVSKAVQRGAFETLKDGALAATVPLRLTRREESLLPLLAPEATVQEIANQQFVSVNTLRKQVVTLRQKFGATSRDELIRRAHEAGLLNRTAKSSLGPGHR